MQDNMEQKVRRLNQQKLVFQTENEVLKKKMQELQEIRVKYDNIVNSRKYKLLNTITGTPMQENIVLGENGEKLTCIIRGSNDVFTLISSLYKYENDFSGKIIIVLTEDEQQLQKRIEEYFIGKKDCWEILFIEKENTVDVYKILNNIVPLVSTEWLVFIDTNYIFTKPFLRLLNTALQETGCNFLNLPVRDQKTDWIYENQLIEKTVLSGEKIEIVNPEIIRLTKSIEKFSGILNRHAVIMKKGSFEELGMFDVKYGELQALEIAYRIRKNELAIGNCKYVFLSGSDDYQKNNSVDENVRKYFEEKYGYGITNAIEELDEYVKKENRLRVAIIADVENWSYHNIAKQVQSRLEGKMDVDLYFYAYTSNSIQLILALKDYDIIHFMWRGHVYILSEQEASTYLYQIGMNYEEFKNECLDKICITASVYDHLFLEENEKIITNGILDVCDEYTVSSALLSDIYNENFEKKPLMTVTDGVDLKQFYPKHLDRFEDRTDKALVIGWVGNSQFFGMKDKDLKGVNTILKPAIEELRKEGVSVERYFADRQERMISHDNMCDYYSNIDVLICTSLFEGTPNPVLEAMACGVPVISTNVGIVNEAFGEFQKQFILEERSIECLKSQIMKMINHPEYLQLCSRENLISIKKWDWENKTQDFKTFFEETYRKHGKDKL